MVPRVHGGGCFCLDVRVTPQTIPCGKEQGGRGVSGALPVSHPLPLFLHHSPPTGSLLSLHVAGWGALLPFAPEVFLVVSKCVCSHRIILNAQLLFKNTCEAVCSPDPRSPLPPVPGAPAGEGLGGTRRLQCTVGRTSRVQWAEWPGCPEGSVKTSQARWFN